MPLKSTPLYLAGQHATLSVLLAAAQKQPAALQRATCCTSLVQCEAYIHDIECVLFGTVPNATCIDTAPLHHHLLLTSNWVTEFPVTGSGTISTDQIL